MKKLEYWEQFEIEMSVSMNPRILREINLVFRLLFKFTPAPVQRHSRTFSIIRVKQENLYTAMETK